MQLIVHIGMGKTGTTSIQGGLDQNTPTLAAAKVQYLGSWFDVGAGDYIGRSNQIKFFSLPTDELKAFGKLYVEKLLRTSNESAIKTFIISNEALWGQSKKLKPFFDVVADSIDTRFVGYVRNAHDWLPSAYAQWGVVHKVYAGPVRSFRSRAPDLVKAYREVLHWSKLYGDKFTLRDYDSTSDVFQDFVELIGLPTGMESRRLHGRRSDGQMILRLLLNNRCSTPAEPDLFNRVLQSKGNHVLPVREIINNHFDTSEISSVIANETKIFSEIQRRFGIDLTTADKTKPLKKLRDEELRGELIDHMLDVIITLAERVDRLEQLSKHGNGSCEVLPES